MTQLRSKTAEQVVREKYPQAYHERFRKGNGEGYTLIWSDRYRASCVRLAEGKTTAKAWANAAAHIKLR